MSSQPDSRSPPLKTPALCVLSALLLVASGGAVAQETGSPALPQGKLPFSPGLQLGDTVYVSGHLGIDPKSGKVPSSPEEEALQVMRSVEKTLQDAGMTLDDLVSVEVYCTDLKLYGAFNRTYAPLFHRAYPARDFIGVKEILFGAHFEVMGIAVRHAGENKKSTEGAIPSK